MRNCLEMDQVPVVFENVEIHRATILSVKDQSSKQEAKKITFTVNIQPLNGLFELAESGTVIVTGRVYVPEETEPVLTEPFSLLENEPTNLMKQTEVYKELRLRGYEYLGEFQPIVKSNLDGTAGQMLWANNWIPFLGIFEFENT